MRLLILITNLFCLVLSTIWWISSPDWEPAVTTIGLFGGLLLQFSADEGLREKVAPSILPKEKSLIYQSARDLSVANEKTQNTGDNSENYQGEFIVINKGMTYQETRSIAMDVFDEREMELIKRLSKKFAEENSPAAKESPKSNETN